MNKYESLIKQEHAALKYAIEEQSVKYLQLALSDIERQMKQLGLEVDNGKQS